MWTDNVLRNFKPEGQKGRYKFASVDVWPGGLLAAAPTMTRTVYKDTEECVGVSWRWLDDGSTLSDRADEQVTRLEHEYGMKNLKELQARILRENMEQAQKAYKELKEAQAQ